MSSLIEKIFNLTREKKPFSEDKKPKVRVPREYLKYLSDNRKQVISVSPYNKNCISTALYIVGK